MFHFILTVSNIDFSRAAASLTFTANRFLLSPSSNTQRLRWFLPEYYRFVNKSVLERASPMSACSRSDVRRQCWRRRKSHKRFEAERLQRGQMEKGVKLYLSFALSVKSCRELWLAAFQHVTLAPGEDVCWCYIIIIRHVHSLLTNTDLRAKEELRQTKAVQILSVYQQLMKHCCSPPGKRA